ncbi:hypothetical protein [Pseudoxanthomonas sp. PXM02]|uniref:hypothetical protein n=1 Tax=Pseudoxanthomonas sp. PXM02 TaxID=2769294 RepID=UPI0017875CD9|nr:hypothetical protein [Pseudoxanthomonas sp. PXM02]MBD9478392.1 hypothetical protein [Pseudoxanthomonas sp. PXM02]
MHGRNLASLALFMVLGACASSDRVEGADRGARSSEATSDAQPLLRDAQSWTPYAIEKGMGAQWCPDDPSDESGRVRHGGLNRACVGLLPRHLADVLVAIPTEQIFLSTAERTAQVRRPQSYLALPGRGGRPDVMASVDMLEGILLRSFEGTNPSDTVYLVVGPFKCIDGDPLVAREGEYLVGTEACQSAHAETRLYKWVANGKLRDVTSAYLPVPSMTPAEHALTAPFRPNLETGKLDYAPVMRWVVPLKDASPPGRVDDHEYDPVAMPDWVRETRRLGDGLHLGFVVWNGKSFEIRQRVPRSLWPLPYCDPLRPDTRCRDRSPVRDDHFDPFVDKDSSKQAAGTDVAVPAPIQPSVDWPATVVAEREFPAVEVIIDERRKPSKLWLMSSHESGVAQALEFFSGERVADVQVESTGSNFPAERLDYTFAYSFTDRSGHRYASVPGIPYTVGTDQPSIYGAWKDQKGSGHDVVLGDYLFEHTTVTGPDGMPKGVDTPIDVRHLFAGQSICETTACVARTQAPLQQEVEPGFEPITKIIADYNSEKKCWVTLPTLAVDLRDNTILIAIGDKVIRLSSKDLSPIGSVGSVRIIDVRY